MRTYRIRAMVEIALAVALSFALNLVKITPPFAIAGGSISLDMLPIFVVALRLGLGPGLAAGALWGVFNLLFDPFIVHPAQVALDYPIAFAACGLAGLGSGRVNSALRQGRFTMAAIETLPWVLIGGLGRFAAHVVSGVIFFASYAEDAGQTPVVYSLVYNAGYLGPSLLGCAILAAVIVPALGRAVPLPARPSGAAA